MINKPVVDPLTQRMKANAEKLSEFFGYVVPSITSIDMREMYCQGYLQAIQDLQKPSLATVSAMCLQGMLASGLYVEQPVKHVTETASIYANVLLSHLSNTEKLNPPTSTKTS